MNGRNGPGTQDVSKEGVRPYGTIPPFAHEQTERAKIAGRAQNHVKRKIEIVGKSRKRKRKDRRATPLFAHERPKRMKIARHERKRVGNHTERSPFRSRTNETGENRKTCATSRNLETQEELVNAGVVGEFGMERRGENLALAQTDHIAAHRGLNGRGRPDLGHKRSTNEH